MFPFFLDKKEKDMAYVASIISAKPFHLPIYLETTKLKITPPHLISPHLLLSLHPNSILNMHSYQINPQSQLSGLEIGSIFSSRAVMKMRKREGSVHGILSKERERERERQRQRERERERKG